jgi:hypothetical protein
MKTFSPNTRQLSEYLVPLVWYKLHPEWGAWCSAAKIRLIAGKTTDTFIGWHRPGFRVFWRWKSRPGRLRGDGKLV